MATRLANIVRSLFSWLTATLLVAACLGGLYFLLRAEEDLRRRVEQTIGSRFPHHAVSVASARYVSGEGIHLRGLSIVQTDAFGIPRHPDVTCKEAVLHCTLSLKQILREQIRIDHVDLRGLSVHARRDVLGKWNLSQLLPRRERRFALPTLTIEGGHVEIVDQQVPATTFSMTDIEVQLQPAEDARQRQGYAVKLRCRSPHFAQAALGGWFQTEAFEWYVDRGRVANLNVTPELLNLLPEQLRVQLRGLTRLRGRLEVEDFGVWQGPGEASRRFWLRAQLSQGRLDHALLEHPLDEVSIASIHCANYGPQAGWLLRNVRGNYGAATIHLDRVRGSSLLEIEGMHLAGSVEDLTLTRKLRELLPAKQQRIWDKYQPLGLIDASFEIRRQHDRWRFQTDATFRDVSLLCSYFRYPLVHSFGNVSFRQDEQLTVDLWASINNTSDPPPIKIDADVKQPGPHFHGDINVRTNWLPLDKQMSDALPGAAQKLVRDMSASGEVTFHAHLHNLPQQRLQKDIQIEVRNANLRYRTFPYPWQRVRGKIHVTDKLWTLAGFEGVNDSCTVRCDGTWKPTASVAPGQPKGGQLQLHFVAEEIPCDHELRDALPPGPQQIWNSLRPRGSIDRARIDLFYQTGMQKPQIDVLVEQQELRASLDRRGLEIQPSWFPLRMRNVAGTVDYKHNGTLELHHLRAEHGPQQHPVQLQIPNWNDKDVVRPGGSGVLRSDGSWDIHLHRVLADGVDMTPEVVSALPAGMAAGIRKLEFDGKLSFQGALRFTHNRGSKPATRAAWSSRVNVDNGRLRIGNQAVSNIFGEVLVMGRNDAAGWVSAGRAHLDSLHCRDVFVENVDAPWAMDAHSLRFGTAASPSSPQPPQRPQHLTAQLFNGVLQADGTVGLSPDSPFQLNLALLHFDVGEIARDLAMPSKITGRGLARLNLSGSAEGTHTLRGDGTIELDEAKLAKLPAIIEILNNLKVRNAPPDVFSSSKINFEISGPYLNLKQFDLHGESLSLKGKGWIALDRQLDIAFYSILGGEKSWRKSIVPILGQASQQLLQIRVKGNVDEPEWSRSVLPGLNELFQDAPRTSEATRRRR